MSTEAYPVAEQVVRDVIASVEQVTAANGRAYTLTVERAKQAGNNPDHLKAIVHEDDPEEVADSDTACGFKYWTVRLAVQVYIFDSDNFHQIKNVVRGDVENALTADRFRGGWATNTEVRPPETFTDANDASGVIVHLECKFRHLEDNTYSTGG